MLRHRRMWEYDFFIGIVVRAGDHGPPEPFDYEELRVVRRLQRGHADEDFPLPKVEVLGLVRRAGEHGCQVQHVHARFPLGRQLSLLDVPDDLLPLLMADA